MAPRCFLDFFMFKTEKKDKMPDVDNQEPYDDYNAEKYDGPGLQTCDGSRSSKNSCYFNEEPCVYNSSGESDYNPSILSDSVSIAANLESLALPYQYALPSPPLCPPPPPPPPVEKRFKRKSHSSIEPREDEDESN